MIDFFHCSVNFSSFQIVISLLPALINSDGIGSIRGDLYVVWLFGNSEWCVILVCALPSIHSYKVVRQTVWQ